MTEYLKKFLRAFRNLRDRFSLPMPAIVRRHPIVAVLLACMLGYLPLYITIRGDDAHLAVRWEGAVIDWNFRDVGQSVNTCLGKICCSQVCCTGLPAGFPAGAAAGWSIRTGSSP